MKNIEARIVTIGDEILIGQIVDTNSAWLGQKLGAEGIRIREIISISDTLEDIVSTLNQSLDNFQITIVTGGLGPTKDDITKVAFCKVLDCELKEDKNTTEFLRTYLAARSIEFNDLNRSQAFIPSKCVALHNANGTAPGMWAERNGNVIISMPGVPFEMKSLVSDVVIPKLRSTFMLHDITHKTMYTYGLPESLLAERIANWENALHPSLHLAYLPNPNGVRLRLSDYEDSTETATSLIDNAFAELEPLISETILGYISSTIEGALGELLLNKGATLSVAESCTGGRISSRITSQSGSSTYYLGGVCSCSNDLKCNILGVKRESIEQFGAVSEQVAREMAEGVRHITGSDYAISTTGVAGPSGGTDTKPVGTVWIAISTPEGTYAALKSFGNLREQNIERASAFALNMLRTYILGIL